MSWRVLLVWAWVVLCLTAWLAVAALVAGCTVNACSVKAGTNNAPIVCDRRS